MSLTLKKSSSDITSDISAVNVKYKSGSTTHTGSVNKIKLKTANNPNGSIVWCRPTTLTCDMRTGVSKCYVDTLNTEEPSNSIGVSTYTTSTTKKVYYGDKINISYDTDQYSIGNSGGGIYSVGTSAIRSVMRTSPYNPVLDIICNDAKIGIRLASKYPHATKVTASLLYLDSYGNKQIVSDAYGGIVYNVAANATDSYHYTTLSSAYYGKEIYCQSHAEWADNDLSTAYTNIAEVSTQCAKYYTVTCIDRVYGSTTNITTGNLGTNTKKYIYGATASGSDFGTTSSNSNYQYVSCTGGTVSGNYTVYRYWRYVQYLSYTYNSNNSYGYTCSMSVNESNGKIYAGNSKTYCTNVIPTYGILSKVCVYYTIYGSINTGINCTLSLQNRTGYLTVTVTPYDNTVSSNAYVIVSSISVYGSTTSSSSGGSSN